MEEFAFVLAAVLFLVGAFWAGYMRDIGHVLLFAGLTALTVALATAMDVFGAEAP